MKKKILIALLAVLVVCAMTFALTACVKTEEYTLTYRLGAHAADNATAPTGGDYKEGADVTLAGALDGEDGWEFDGWFDGTTKYAAGATYKMPAKDVVMTAQWKTVGSGGGHVCEDVCATCGKCQSACTDSACAQKCLVTCSGNPNYNGGDEGPWTVTYNIESIADDEEWTNATIYEELPKLDENISISATCANPNSRGQNTGTYYENGENWRIYQNETPTLSISIASGYKISSITVTFTVSNTGTLKVLGGDDVLESEVPYTVNDFSIELTVGQSGSVDNGQVRITEIVVVYNVIGANEHAHIWGEYSPVSGSIKHSASCTVANCNETNTVPCAPVENVCSVCHHTYTATEIVTALFELGPNSELPGSTWKLTGEVVSIAEQSTQHGNATFDIKVANKTVTAYRVKGEGYDTLKVGDTVTIVGKLVSFGADGVKEFSSGSTITSVVPASHAGEMFALSVEGDENATVTDKNGGDLLSEYEWGTTVEFKVEPDQGYTVTLVKANTTTLTATAGVYSFDIKEITTIHITVVLDNNSGEENNDDEVNSVVISSDSLEYTDTNYGNAEKSINGVKIHADKIYYNSAGYLQVNKTQSSAIWNTTAFSGRIVSIEVAWNAAYTRSGDILTLAFGNSLAFNKTDNSYVINRENTTDATSTFTVPKELNCAFVKLVAVHANVVMFDSITINYSKEAYTPVLEDYDLSVVINPNAQTASTQVTTPAGGALDTSTTYQEGTTIEFKVSPANDWKVKEVTINGEKIDADVDGVYSFIIADDTDIVITLEADSGEVWKLVTDISQLSENAQIIIVSGSKALSTSQASNNRNNPVDVKVENNVIATIPGTVQVITLKAGNKADTFAFYVEGDTTGYLYAASSSNNYLKTKNTLDDNGSWKIEVTAAGVATITAQGTYTRNQLKYNSDSSLFSCYSSGQTDVSIYVLTSGD